MVLPGSDILRLIINAIPFLKHIIDYLFPKGIVLDFMEPWGLRLGAGYSKYMPTNLSIDFDLVAWNQDQNPHLFQKITKVELCGLEKAGWRSGLGGTYECNSHNSSQLPMSLSPGVQLPIRLRVNVQFTVVDANRFVEQFRNLKNEKQEIRVEYIVRERDKTKTKELKKADINFYESFYPSYNSYSSDLANRDNVEAKRLLNLLQTEGT